MAKQNKGGRPRTGRDTPVTIKLSDDALRVLQDHPNKSAFIDKLIRGEVSQVECPRCGEVITIKTE